jgi:transposase
MTDDMAREYDVSYYTVSRRATRLGVGKSDEFMRSAWRKGSLTKYKIRGEERKQFKRAADEYLKAHFHDTSNAELSALFGVDVKTIRRWARRLGLQKSDEFMFKSRSGGSKGYYTDEQKAWRNRRIAEVYPDADEEGLQQLADELGVKRSSLEKLVVKLGVKRSPQRVAEAKQRGHDKSRKYSRELIAAVAEYYPYHSTEECAEKFGINLGTLNQIATHSGWKKDKAYRSRMTSEMLRRRYSEKNNK